MDDGSIMNGIVKSQRLIVPPPGGAKAFWQYFPSPILPKIILRWLFHHSDHSAFALNV